MKCSLLAGLVAGAVFVFHLYRGVDETIRRRVESTLAQHYAHLKVTVRTAELVQGKGIVVRGLRIAEPETEGLEGELLHVEEMFLTCRTELEELLKGEPEVTHVVLRRPTLRVRRREDGTWSAARLMPLPQRQCRSPEIRIDNGTIEIADTSSPAMTLRDLNLALAAPAEPDQAGDGPRMRKFSGRFVADMVRQVEVSGLLDPCRPQWTMSGSVEGLELSPELREMLPAEWGAKLAALGSLRGQGKLRFQAGYDPEAASPYRFDLSGSLVRARLDDPRLPHSLTDIRATFSLTNDGFAVQDLFARSGQSTLQASCSGQGLDGQSPLRLKAEIRDLDLDPKYAELLPTALQDQWHKYLPAGHVDADVELVYDGARWQPDISVRCLGVSFSYEKLPYRLEQSQGTVELKGDVLTANVTGYSASRPVRVEVEVTQPFSGPCGWVEARGDNLPLDEKLMAALAKKTRAVVRSFNPHGTINVFGRTWRKSPDEPWHRHLVVGLNRCAVRYERFPYPIGNVCGTLEMLDDRWTFRELSGTNDTGLMTCEGTLYPTAEGPQWSLRLTGTNVPMEEELRDAMSPGMQQAWNDFKPQGTVDLEEARIANVPGTERLDVELRVRPRRESTSIEPVHFPYRLEKLQGLLVYRNGQVTLEGFRGEHGNARLSTTGQGAFLPDGSWQFQFDGLTVDRLRIDRELTQALPGRLKKAVAELNPSGPIYLRGGKGGLILARGGNLDDPITSQWDLQIGFDQTSIDFGLKVQNVYGTLQLAGGHDGRRFVSRGELNVESATYRDFQFTRITGPIWMDDEQLLFGAWVDRPPPGRSAARPSERSQAARPLAAQLFGGTVLADGWVAFGATPHYQVHATLSQADMARLAQEALPGPQTLRGKLHGEVELRGTGRSLNLLGGHGNVQIRDADLYELPLMIALLKIASIRQPDRSAFSTSDVDFRIEGNHIYLDRIQFSGDAISLVGNGEMNFQSELRLRLHAMMGRGNLNLPVLREVLGGASQQILLVHVGGTLQNPETTRQPFPGVNRALQQIQADWQNGPGAAARSESGSWPGNVLRKLPKQL